MKIDFTIILRELDGEPIVDAQDATKGPLTLKTAAYRALLAQFTDEPPDGERSYKRYKIASKLVDAENPKEIELSTEEVGDLKKLIGKAWGPLVVGRCWDAIESVATPKPDKTERKPRPHAVA